MEQIINSLKRIAKENPSGFTVSLESLKFVKEGWVVAIKETQNSFGDVGLRKALQVAMKTSNTLGGWKEGEDFYWDAVIIFNNEEDATKAGVENEQIAIYNIETNFLKYLV
jgi:hypothetical protein